MSWPIPDIPQKSTLPVPRYRLWWSLLLLMVMAGSSLALFMGQYSTYTPVLLYGVLPAFLLWLCFFGLTLNRYDQSRASAYAWHQETKITKSKWQQWSRKQLAVVGNIVITPEPKGVSAVLGPPSEIPLFPKKARPLWGENQGLPVRLRIIDEELEKQAPSYRYHLYTIYILHSSELYRELIEDAVFEHWLLVPQFVKSFTEIAELNFEREVKEIIMVLHLQIWPAHKPLKFSELISAQLLSSPAFIYKNDFPILAGLGRMMPLSPGVLHKDLACLFEYNNLDVNDLSYVWLSGDTRDNAVAVLTYAELTQWLLPKNRPIHYIDLTFGPPGELSFGISLSMMVEAARATSKNQLIIYQTPQSSGFLCLITKELFS